MRSLSFQGDDYQVSLTRPKRNCDVARFVVQKQGGKTYIVTFQNHQGTKGQCNCQAGKNRKFCRHQKMLKPLLDKAVAAATGAIPKVEVSKPTVPVQTKLPLEDPRVAAQYQAARAEYVKLRSERDAIEAKLKAVEARGKALKAKLEAA